MNLEAFGLSRVGRVRSNNEDRFLVRHVGRGVLLAVADGIGGQYGGARAAGFAIQSFREFDAEAAPELALNRCMTKANESIYLHRVENPRLRHMGTTLTAVYADPFRAVYIHAGDSRFYLLRDATSTLVTRDHSTLRTMIETGDVTAAMARMHLERDSLEQCLGCPDLEPDRGELRLDAGDVLLVCTDGLYREVADDTMTRTLVGGVPLRLAILELAATALASGARDNFTMVSARI
ncbi:protein serine/threonine phosphatase [Desulfovibrio ferrophilus]|uniref:Protein serine/threonine phosphatase n=2 Tax=Desulfovibrio ferrophilus TaxID=241368 RepID=A0A2Z6AVJ3_9BACT|nr:protein serine/threonine phosphatase [Desulfovibrio ferrophilus]